MTATLPVHSYQFLTRSTWPKHSRNCTPETLDGPNVFVRKCYGEYTNKEVASELSVSVETVKNDWRSAKVWLEKKLASYAP